MNLTADQVVDLVRKWKLAGCQDAIDQIRADQPIKVAFLGSFSSGKTSLINAILGTHLPVGTVPTTKTICFIEPSATSIEGQDYYKRLNNSWEPISLDEFGELLCGNIEPEAVRVLVQPSSILPNGSFFVDTPGDGSLSAESQLTKSYLRNVDASVFCIDIKDGTVKQSVLDFISDTALKPVWGNMVFALTKADLTSDEECEIIRNEIIERLTVLASRGKFDAANIQDRVICVSAKEAPEQTWNVLNGALSNFVYGHQADIKKIRISRDIVAYAPQVLAAMRGLLDVMSLDTSALREKEAIIEQETSRLEMEIRHDNNVFAKFSEALPEAMGNAYDRTAFQLISAKTAEERMAVGQCVFEAIKEDAIATVKRFLGEGLTIQCDFASMVVTELPSMLGNIDNMCHFVSEIAFIGVTSALTCGATGAAAGGMTAAGGAAAGAGGAAVARALGSTAVKVAAKEGVKHTMSSVLAGVCSVLNKINPFEMIASACSPSLQDQKIKDFRSAVTSKAAGIAFNLEAQYNDLVIAPKVRALADQKSAMHEVEDEEDCASKEYLSHKTDLNEDIEKLSAMLGEEK